MNLNFTAQRAARDQSEDYCRPEDVLVYRDTPQGLVASRVIDETPRQALTRVVNRCIAEGSPVIVEQRSDEARNADLPPGFSWFVRNPKTGQWFSDAKDAWVARDHATQFGTFEAAENAIKVNGLRGAQVKASQSVR